MKVYTIKEVAQMFKVTKHAVYCWIKKGYITKITGTHKISEEELKKFMNVKK